MKLRSWASSEGETVQLHPELVHNYQLNYISLAHASMNMVSLAVSWAIFPIPMRNS